MDPLPSWIFYPQNVTRWLAVSLNNIAYYHLNLQFYNGQSGMSFNKNRTLQQRLGPLRTLAMGLKEPESYFVGIHRPPLDIPTNVLMFCRHFRGATPPAVPNANLDQIVLLVSLGGTGTVHLDHRPIQLGAGQALVVFPHQIHAYTDLDRDRLVWLVISFQVQRPDTLTPFRNAPVALTPAALALVRELIAGYGQREPTAAAQAAGIAITLWRLILELLAQAGPSRPSGAPALMEELVIRVQQYIVEHIREPIRIRDVARTLGVSESKLCTDFRRFMQMGLGTFIRRWRVFYACRLMKASSDRLAAISAQCGFGSVYAFSRTFKQVMHITPSEWRLRQATAVSSRPAGNGSSRPVGPGRT